MEERVILSNISKELAERLDRAVGEAIEAVEEGYVSKAQASIAFEFTPDEDMKALGKFTFKHTRTESGTFVTPRQAAIPGLMSE